VLICAVREGEGRPGAAEEGGQGRKTGVRSTFGPSNEEAFADDLALAGAAKGGHAVLCQRLLTRGAEVNDAAGRDRSSPLLYALRGSTVLGSAETVTQLIDAGADVGVENRYGTLGLHAASWCGASVELFRANT